MLNTGATKKELKYHDRYYDFIEVDETINTCSLCSFTNLDNNGPWNCRDIPGSGCCMPFGNNTYYGYWKLRR